MEKTAHYFTVGLAVTIAIFSLVGFLIWMAGPNDKKKMDVYIVEFNDPISGLEEGASVEYMGVKVGKVEKMALAPGRVDAVRVKIGVNKSTPIRKNTRISLEMQGITGLVRLEMKTDPNDTEMPEVPEGMKYPLLIGSGSTFYKTMENIPAIAANIRSITDKLDKALDEETVSSIRRTLLNAEHMSRDLNGLLAPGNIANFALLLGNLTIASVRVPNLVTQLEGAAEGMSGAATSLDSMLKRSRPAVDRFTTQGLPQITAASKEAKGTASSFRKLADKLSEDPSKVIYQPKSHGVEIPK